MWFRILPLQACLSASVVSWSSCQLSMVAQDTKHVKQNFRVVWRGGETINNLLPESFRIVLKHKCRKSFLKILCIKKHLVSMRNMYNQMHPGIFLRFTTS
jgi:hypothetical protein